MEPNQGMMGAQGVNNATSAGAPVNVAPEPPKKKSNAMALGMILLAIIAAGGIGFGVWAMLDGNAQKEQLNLQISTLETQNSELNTRIAELEEEIAKLDGVDDGDDDYIYIDELGIKIKKSDNFPDMVAKTTDTGHFIVKETSDISDDSSAPSLVDWMTVSTCDPEELTLGYGAKMEIGETCYIMGEILPYGSDDEYPLTDFLIYVMDSENYSEI